jgi:hypothetical protein
VGTDRAYGPFQTEGVPPMLRDIDYAAEAVKKAIVEKFGRQNPTDNLQVTANEKTITVQDGQQLAEGTRDSLLAALRKAGSYDQFWGQFTAIRA